MASEHNLPRVYPVSPGLGRDLKPRPHWVTVGCNADAFYVDDQVSASLKGIFSVRCLEKNLSEIFEMNGNAF